FDSPLGMPVLSRYADCVAMLRHPDASSDSRNSEMYEQFRAQQVTVDADEEMLGAMQTFLFMDPPDHTRLRGLVTKAFTPRVVEEMRPRIMQLVGELLDGVEGRGGCELIEDLAYPLPVTVISDLLGG